jgi:hypothetical protein
MPPRARIPVPPTDPNGDHRARLVALRDRLTAELDAGPSAAAVAALARQLQAVLAELAAMPDPHAKPSPIDEIVRRREERRGGGAA